MLLLSIYEQLNLCQEFWKKSPYLVLIFENVNPNRNVECDFLDDL